LSEGNDKKSYEKLYKKDIDFIIENINKLKARANGI
jgi:phage terminase Nu1 subunit (DNA packaging protein)